MMDDVRTYDKTIVTRCVALQNPFEFYSINLMLSTSLHITRIAESVAYPT